MQKRRCVLKESVAQAKMRFEMELEFVQLLANPSYLQYLAQHKYFDDPAFINYLKYLLYWKEPEYAQYIIYPNSLFFLERLQEAKFRKELVQEGFVAELNTQQFLHWQFYRNNRIKAANALAQDEPPPQ